MLVLVRAVLVLVIAVLVRAGAGTWCWYLVPLVPLQHLLVRHVLLLLHLLLVLLVLLHPLLPLLLLRHLLVRRNRCWYGCWCWYLPLAVPVLVLVPPSSSLGWKHYCRIPVMSDKPSFSGGGTACGWEG